MDSVADIHKSISAILTELATIAVATGKLTHAARLFGAAEAQHTNIDMLVPPTELATFVRSLAAVRSQLGDATFAAAWAEGHALTPSQAIAILEPNLGTN